MRFLTALAALSLVLAGCSRDQNRWTAGQTGDGLPVVVAPVAAPAITSAWPDAPLALAHTAASRIDLFGRGLDGFVGETLPAADQAAWNAPVAGAAGATVVVLVTLEAPQRTVSGTTPLVVVEGHLRILDAQGHEEFARRVRGTVENVVQAKLIGPAHTPAAEAANSALADAANQVVDYLKTRGNRPSAAATVTLTLGSTPANADVLVNGQLKGTTPCTIELPTGKPAILRLERQGHRPWERSLTPTEPLSLSPALEPGN